MNQWLASGDARPAKHQRSEAATPQELDMHLVGKLLLLLSKLSLRHSLEINELQSATFKTIVMGTESSFISEAQEATRSFVEKAKNARETRNNKAIDELGEPQYHSWAALIKVAVEDTAMSQQDRDVLTAHFNGVRSVADLTDKVFIAKVKRCYDKRVNKVHLAVCAELSPVLDALLRAMSRAGGKIKRGQPPRSGNDRELQDLVDKLARIVQDD
ncbi:unnamed protein product [Symbiodinium sp. CCMP2592]|nr:unnamed protein product [Symbiodinium sp. CCMP2592]